MVFFVIFVIVLTVLLFTLVAARFSFQILKVFRIGEGRKLRSFVSSIAGRGLLHLTINFNGRRNMFKKYISCLAKLETCTRSLVFLSLVLGIGMLVTLFAMLSCSMVVMIFSMVHFNQKFS